MNLSASHNNDDVDEEGRKEEGEILGVEASSNYSCKGSREGTFPLISYRRAPFHILGEMDVDSEGFCSIYWTLAFHRWNSGKNYLEKKILNVKNYYSSSTTSMWFQDFDEYYQYPSTMNWFWLDLWWSFGILRSVSNAWLQHIFHVFHSFLSEKETKLGGWNSTETLALWRRLDHLQKQASPLQSPINFWEKIWFLEAYRPRI